MARWDVVREVFASQAPCIAAFQMQGSLNMAENLVSHVMLSRYKRIRSLLCEIGQLVPDFSSDPIDQTRTATSPHKSMEKFMSIRGNLSHALHHNVFHLLDFPISTNTANIVNQWPSVSVR